MLDPFYPVVPDAGWVAKLVPVGTRLIQLRIKEQSDAEVRRQVREAKGVCAAHGAQLIVNDYWQTAIDEGCDYVHLGQEDLVDADVKALRRAGLRIGVSTHDHAELDKGLAIDPDQHFVVTCGSTEAMMVAMMTACNPGDKVIVFSPF